MATKVNVQPASFIQPSFASGELSPSLYSRVDIAKYQSGLRTCRNFIVHPHGGASNRPGTKFVAEVKDSTTAVRLERFIFSEDQAYIFELGDEYMRFFSNQAAVYDSVSVSGGIDEYTRLALHFEGADASTTFTDSSTFNHTMYPYGNAQIDTAQFKFGSASGLFDNTGDYITFNHATAFTLSTSDFTIDYWVRRTNVTGNDVVLSRWTSGASYFYVAHEGGNLRFRDYGGTIDITRAVTMVNDTWYHVAITRSGQNIRLFLNGVQQGATVVTAAAFAARTSALAIGMLSGVPTYDMQGHIDELRFDIGIARWTADFTPPTSPYTDYIVSNVIYELVTPWAAEDVAQLRFESSADTVYITHPDYPPYVLSRYDNTDWTLEEYVSDNGPFMPENTDEDVTLAVSATTGATVNLAAVGGAVFSDLHVGALFKIRHYVGGQAASSSFSSDVSGSSIGCFTTWRLITHGTWAGNLKVEKSDDGGVSWTTLRTFSSKSDMNVNTYGTEDLETNIEPFLVRLTMSGMTSGTCNADLTTDAYYQTGIIRITSVSSSILAIGSVLSTFGSTSASELWSEGSWSDYRGYPAVSRFYQDRLCFAGTYAEPMTTWMTEVGNYISFYRHSVLLDSDGITANIPSRQLNAINGLVALKKLLAFTSASEWTIGPTSGEALGPKTVEQVPEGYRGSFGPEPAVVGNECIFVQANGKVIRNFGYQWAENSFKGSDLNILARHLFHKYSIIQIAYQQDPDSVVWCLRDDGQLLGMTYMPEQDVIAWSRHDTDGEIQSIAVIPGDGFDELWMVVERENGKFVEYMTQRSIYIECAGEKIFSLDDQVFMDSTVSFSNRVDIDSVAIDDETIELDIPSHGLSDGDTFFVDCVDGPDINDILWYAKTTWNGTWLLIHGDGAEGATQNHADSSHYDFDITSVGSKLPTVTQSVKVFGTGSLFFDFDTTGNDDYPCYLSVADGGNIQLGGSQDFTFECRMRLPVYGPSTGIVAMSIPLLTKFDSATDYWSFSYTYPVGGPGYLRFGYKSGAGAEAGVQVTWSHTIDRWHAIAIVKQGSDKMRFYVDGHLVGTEQTLLGGIPATQHTAATTIGDTSTWVPGNAGGKQVYLDEIRVSSIARYSGSSYTLATRPFADSANSIILADPDTTQPIPGVGYATYVQGGYITGVVDAYDGLDHLEGQSVVILADGEVLDQQVVTDGAISLTENYATVHVGLPYYADLETLNIEWGLQNGTLQGMKIKIGNVMFRLENTRGGWIGPNEDNLYEAFPDAIEAKLLAQGDPITDMYTGDIRIPLGAGYEDGGRVFYRQVDPLPVTISAIVPEVAPGGPSAA